MNAALAEYAAKREVVDLLSWRALGADRFDIGLMRACHPLDATDNHGTYQGSMHGFIDDLDRRSREGPPCLAKEHIVANVLVDLRGPDGLLYRGTLPRHVSQDRRPLADPASRHRLRLVAGKARHGLRLRPCPAGRLARDARRRRSDLCPRAALARRVASPLATHAGAKDHV